MKPELWQTQPHQNEPFAGAKKAAVNRDRVITLIIISSYSLEITTDSFPG